MNSPMAETEARDRYRHFLSIQTRFMDNDAYGHLNNVVYYSLFDTVINRYLIEQGELDIVKSPIVGFCVESHCVYHRPLAFPDVVDAGLRVAHLGRSSVRYEVGVFAGGESETSAHGWFVHVFVDRAARRPAELPPAIRTALEKLL